MWSLIFSEFGHLRYTALVHTEKYYILIHRHNINILTNFKYYRRYLAKYTLLI